MKLYINTHDDKTHSITFSDACGLYISPLAEGLTAEAAVHLKNSFEMIYRKGQADAVEHVNGFLLGLKREATRA